MKIIVYTTPDTYNESNPLDAEILTGQVAYLIKDNNDGTGIFSVKSRQDGERFEKVLPFSYLMKHDVDMPHAKDTEKARIEMLQHGAHHLTIRDLKKYLEDHKDDLDEDGIVYYQRIDDVYFEENGWDNSVRVKYEYNSGDFNPLFAWEDQFVPAFCCYGFHHPDDPQKDRNLYITAHY